MTVTQSAQYKVLELAHISAMQAASKNVIDYTCAFPSLTCHTHTSAIIKSNN